MKKFTSLFAMIVLITLNAHSQTVLYSNNFDSYTVGGYLAVQNPAWFQTWSNAPGTAEDALISNAFSKSPSKSVMISGTNDMLLKLGNKTTGTYELKWMMYVESGKAGFYNIQHFQTPGTADEYAMRVFFRTNGNGELNVGGAYFQFNYPKDTWFEVKHLIDLDANTIKYYVNGVIVKEWPFNYQINSTSGTKQLGGVDFFAGIKSGSGETPKYFVDDISFQEVPSTTPSAPGWTWAKSFGGTGNDSGISTVDAYGNVYTTGSFFGAVDFDPGEGTFNLTSDGTWDIFISKMDASGNFMWAKRIGGISDDIGISIALDASGNIYTTGSYSGTVDFDPGAGTFNLTSTGSADIYISKLDGSGNFVWAKALGGTGDAYIETHSITCSPNENGDVYTTGAFVGSIDFDPGAATHIISSVGDVDIFISKLDSLGNFVWTNTLGGGEVYGNSIAIDGSGNIYTTGYFSGTVDFDPGAGTFNLTSAGGYDIFISKTDVSGNFIWAKRIGGTGTDIGSFLVLDASGNIYSTGSYSATVDFDPDAGTSYLTSNGSADIYISKFDDSGNFSWAKGIGSTGIDVGYSIAFDPAGSGAVYTTGGFQGTADFDPGAGTFNLSSVGDADIFISKLDNLGNFVWATAAGGIGYDYCSSVDLDAMGNVYVAGGFRPPSISFGSDTLVNAASTGGNFDVYIAKIGTTLTGIESEKADDGISVYPNPGNGKFTIGSKGRINKIEIYNLLGAKVYSDYNFNRQTSNEVDLAGYAKGIYLVKIYDGTQLYSRKVVVQ